jgi:hypothetical protein
MKHEGEGQEGTVKLRIHHSQNQHARNILPMQPTPAPLIADQMPRRFLANSHENPIREGLGYLRVTSCPSWLMNLGT